MPDYQKFSDGQHNIIYHGETFPQISADYFSPDHWQRENAITGQSRGRGITYFFRHQNREFVLRHYLRGGLVNKLFHDQYWFGGVEKSRSWQEFDLLAKMKAHQLPVPSPAAARMTRQGWFYRADIIIERIPGATDLHHQLCNNRLSADVWRKTGLAVKQLHQHQIYHHDLNIHNILLDQQGNIWIIDFDQCQEKSGENWKQGNLNRLLRSLNKEADRHPVYHWQNEDWQTLQNAYNS